MTTMTIEFETSAAQKTAINGAVRKVENLRHIEKIASAMAPEPRDWSYEGEIADAGQQGAYCTCGHPIRYVFTIRNKKSGRALPIGSTCIETTVPFLMSHGAADLADRLTAAVGKLKAEIAAAEKAKRDAEQNERVLTLLQDRTALLEYASAEKSRRGFIQSRSLWSLTMRKPKALTTPGRTARSLLNTLADVVVTLTRQDYFGALVAKLSHETREEVAKALLQSKNEVALTAIYGTPE